jgi:uncharacterized protein GlcG (DUF336 family)
MAGGVFGLGAAQNAQFQPELNGVLARGLGNRRSGRPGDGAWQMINSAVVESTSVSTPVTVVVGDESGVVKSMLRMDGAPLVSVQTAINRAIGIPPDRRHTPTSEPRSEESSTAKRLHRRSRATGDARQTTSPSVSRIHVTNAATRFESWPFVRERRQTARLRLFQGNREVR